MTSEIEQVTSLATTTLVAEHTVLTLRRMSITDYVIIILNSIICVIGLIGNFFVIYAVVKYPKLRTVTNVYILNLAIADMSHLLSLPLVSTTQVIKHWIFGEIMCKLYYGLTNVNTFTCVLLLTMMSIDRYLAICHPITSAVYRTIKISTISCLVMWIMSFLAMLPILLYAQTTPHPISGLMSCNVIWPAANLISQARAFISYSFVLGFAVPITLSSVFYTALLCRLRTLGQRHMSWSQRHRKVTRLVLIIVATYIICWLPYWSTQMRIVAHPQKAKLPWEKYLFGFFNVLSTSNSMLNPFLYAFFSTPFRSAFRGMCCQKPISNSSTALGTMGRSTGRNVVVTQLNKRTSTSVPKLAHMH